MGARSFNLAADFTGYLPPPRRADMPIMLPLYDPDDLGGDGGDGGAGDDGGAGGDPGTPPTGDNSRTADPPRGAPSGTPAGRQGADPANRSTASGSRATGTRGDGVVPSHRLREANARAARIEAENRRLRAILAQAQYGGHQPPARTAATTRTSDVDPETQQVRQAFREMFPTLYALEERGIDVERLVHVLSDTTPQELAKQFWGRVGSEHLSGVERFVKEDYGDKVAPSTIRHFQSLYITWLEDDPDRKERYLAGDNSLVDDFWADVRADVVEPIRSSATDVVRERAERVNALPKFTGRVGPVGTGRKPKAGMTEDQLHDAAFEALQQQLR